MHPAFPSDVQGYLRERLDLVKIGRLGCRQRVSSSIYKERGLGQRYAPFDEHQGDTTYSVAGNANPV